MVWSSRMNRKRSYVVLKVADDASVSWSAARDYRGRIVFIWQHDDTLPKRPTK